MKKWFVIIIFWLPAINCLAQQPDSLPAVDSISWKDDKGFSYMANLDSLLRVVNHKIDSVTLNRKIDIPGSYKSSPGFASFFQNTIVQIIFWSVLAFFIGYIIYTIFFRYPRSRVLTNENDAAVIQDGELCDESVYRQQIDLAEQDGKFRHAVRFHFLLVLSQLDALGKIRFAPEKTNADYLHELEDEHVRAGFAGLSNIFTYTWYGKKEIGAAAYAEIKKMFTYNDFSR